MGFRWVHFRQVGLSLESFSTSLVLIGAGSSVGPNSDETVSSVGPNSDERLAPAQKCKKCSVFPYSNTVEGTVVEYG